MTFDTSGRDSKKSKICGSVFVVFIGFSREEARERDKAEPTNKQMGYLTHSTQNKYAKEYASDLRKSAVGIQERVMGTSRRHGEKKPKTNPRLRGPRHVGFLAAN